MPPAPLGQSPVGVFQELIPPAGGDSDLESKCPDDFHLARVGGDEAVAEPDDEALRGPERAHRPIRNTPAKQAEVEDDFFPGHGEPSGQDEPVHGQDKKRRSEEDGRPQPRFFGRLFGKNVAMAGVDLEQYPQRDQQDDREHEQNLDPGIILDRILEDYHVHLNSPSRDSSSGALFAAAPRF